ncbi:lasso RiPP family leader peptide-containing protein [Erythrobacter sp. R86502]
MSNTASAQKASYSAPKLLIYGGFSELTAAGSSANVETRMGMRTPRA